MGTQYTRYLADEARRQRELRQTYQNNYEEAQADYKQAIDAYKTGNNIDSLNMNALAYYNTVDSKIKKQQRDAEAAVKKERDSMDWLTRTFHTIGDGLGRFTQGVMKFGENIVDAGATLFGADEEWIAKDHVDDWFGNALRNGTKGSYLYDGKVGKTIGDVLNGVGNMLPSIALNLIPGIGQAASMGSFMVNAGGQGMENSLANGATRGEALGYGTLSGISEGVIEKMSGGIGGVGKGLLDSVGKGAVKTGIRGGIGRAAKTFIGEGLEEVASDLLDPVLAGIYKHKIDYSGVTPDSLLNSFSLIEEMKNKCFNALKIGYIVSFKSHYTHWTDYFDMSNIAIEDKELERLYNFTDYLLGSGSARGNYPMPLQGLWTQNDGKTLPPWKGDYHHDLNTELTYSSYIKGNRLEQGLSFIEYLIALNGRGKEFAAKFYSAPGICLPSVMDIDGYALGGWPLYSLSPTNQLWLCQIIARHYEYTGDKKFLEKIAYPYIRQSTLFIASLLKKDSDGYYKLPISGSPEIHDNTAKSYLIPNSNYDESLLIYIFKTIKSFAKILNVDDGNWDKYLNFLRPLAINDKSVLMLDNKETLVESHRHLSHLMSIYPLRLLDYNNENDRNVIDASIDYTVSLGSKYYTGLYICLAGMSVCC